MQYGREYPKERRMHQLFQSILSLASQVGADPRDREDIRLQKTVLVLGSGMFIVAGAAWGLMYWALGEWLAGSIPFGYAVISTLSVILFTRIRVPHHCLSCSLCRRRRARTRRR
jgi:hypothetical protein